MSGTPIPGGFSWLELGTTDKEAAKGFYSALFGWGFHEFPMGPDDTYTIFHMGDRSTGAAYEMGTEMTARGIPPHWMLYITVVDADASAAKAAELGGAVVSPPFNVMDQVRMAVLRDPTGAYFSIAQPINHTGFGVKNEPGAFAWADLFSPDSEKAAKFYTELFGWTTYVGDSPYIHFKNGEDYIAGSMPGTLTEGVPPHWMPYITVADCDASLEKAASLGATTLYGPVTMEGIGRFATIADPQGAAISIFQAPAN